ncbi:hypothetical protein Vafri_20526, partial [Volvox africanus]
MLLLLLPRQLLSRHQSGLLNRRRATDTSSIRYVRNGRFRRTPLTNRLKHVHQTPSRFRPLVFPFPLPRRAAGAAICFLGAVAIFFLPLAPRRGRRAPQTSTLLV